MVIHWLRVTTLLLLSSSLHCVILPVTKPWFHSAALGITQIWGLSRQNARVEIILDCFKAFCIHAEFLIYQQRNLPKNYLIAKKQTTYGCPVNNFISSDARIDNRLAKANSAFGRLHKRVWKNNHLKKHTNISVYRAVIIPTLLFGSESWVLYRHHLRLLERFHQHCLRSILNIHWSDNIEVLELAESSSIESTLLKTQLRWVDHVSRMEDHRLPKIVLYGELSTGHRERGAPRKRYKDCLKKSLGACHIEHHQWADIASNRASCASQFGGQQPPLKKTAEPTSLTKDKGRKTQHPTRTNQFSLATVPACPASDLSVTNEPAADVDIPLHKSSSSKPSQRKKERRKNYGKKTQNTVLSKRHVVN
ncbi:uncharacterized protein [Narcine bancroftii]|uniref:uncharacterized protein n=1 Tax=Narcine bancroftii TaxID=1343680 RepID=UPI003831D34E